MLTPSSLLAIALSVAVAASDLYSRRVPNRWLAYALLLGSAWFCVAWLWEGAGFPSANLLGLAIGLAVMLPFHALRLMGAGDVKFFAVLGFLLSWHALLPIWMIASLLAGLHALAAMFTRQSHWQISLGLPAYTAGGAWREKLQNARQGRQGAPYATCLAAGAVVTVFFLREWPHG